MKSQSTAGAGRVPTRAASTLACASAISRMDRRKSSYGATESVTTATPQPPPETTFMAAIPAKTPPPSLSEPPSSSTLRDRKLTARAPSSSSSSSSRLRAATWRWRTPEKELVRGCMHAESNEPAAAAAEGEGDGLWLALGRPWPWSFLRALGKWRNDLSLARFLLLLLFFLDSSSIPSMFLLISWYVET
uniref:Uncharacterized protein n=1 Tax=Triticum urartu TaxID=4572 RepID=A0A8R7QFU0_TRIUA